MQFIGDDDKIPVQNRDELWKCNLIVDDDVEQRLFVGSQTKSQNVMKFQCGKEIIAGIAIKPKSMMKFQWETDQYSTALNIQKPSVNPQFWEEKM